MFSSPTQCLLDGKPVNGFKGLSLYLTKRGISHKEYYDQFLKREGEGICVICKEEAKFIRISEGYHHLCGKPECTSKARATYSIESIAARNKITLEEAKKILADRTSRHTESWLKTIEQRSESDPNYMKRMTGYSKDSYIARGYSEEEADKKAKEVGKRVSSSQIEWNKKPENKELIKKTRWNNVQYWIEKGMTPEEAVAEIAKLQTRDLTFFQKKYGEEEGKKKWEERQKNWKAKVFNEDQWIGRGRSNVSEKFFDTICSLSTEDAKRGSDEKFIWDKELQRAYKYDLVFIDSKKIIEFNGDFWHCNPQKFNPDYFHKVKKMTAQEIWDYDRIKREKAEEHGYDVLVVWESDWYKNQEEVINKCKSFIYNSK